MTGGKSKAASNTMITVATSSSISVCPLTSETGDPAVLFKRNWFPNDGARAETYPGMAFDFIFPTADYGISSLSSPVQRERAATVTEFVSWFPAEDTCPWRSRRLGVKHGGGTSQAFPVVSFFRKRRPLGPSALFR